MKILESLGLVEYGGPTGLGLIVIFAALFGGLFAAAFGVDALSCSQYGDSTGRATDYRIPAGCFVGTGGHFIPLDEYNARAITHDQPTN